MMDNIWKFTVKKCIDAEFGGIVVAESKEIAEQKIKEKYNYNALEDTIVVWKAVSDENYNKDYPDVLEIKQ